MLDFRLVLYQYKQGEDRGGRIKTHIASGDSGYPVRDAILVGRGGMRDSYSLDTGSLSINRVRYRMGSGVLPAARAMLWQGVLV
jgi:hypothetical protein